MGTWSSLSLGCFPKEQCIFQSKVRPMVMPFTICFVADLFKVEINFSGLNKTARKLDIDCAPAMIGWEFSGGGCHPVFDGFVVCTEHQEVLMDAWNTEVEEKAKKDAAKKEKRVLDNWKKLAKGLLTAEKIKRKYLK